MKRLILLLLICTAATSLIQYQVRHRSGASLGANGVDKTWSCNIPSKEKQTYCFTIEVRLEGSRSDNSDNIQIAVMRLSQ
jgi:hypothetical protein